MFPPGRCICILAIAIVAPLSDILIANSCQASVKLRAMGRWSIIRKKAAQGRARKESQNTEGDADTDSNTDSNSDVDSGAEDGTPHHDGKELVAHIAKDLPPRKGSTSLFGSASKLFGSAQPTREGGGRVLKESDLGKSE